MSSAVLIETPAGLTLGFGKHRGEPLSDVPLDYLRWCLRDLTDASEAFRQAVRDEIHRRAHAGVGSFDFEE